MAVHELTAVEITGDDTGMAIMRAANATGIVVTSPAGLATALIAVTAADAARLSLMDRGNFMDRAATNISILATAGPRTGVRLANMAGQEFRRTRPLGDRKHASETCHHPVIAEEDSGIPSMHMAGRAMGAATPLGREWRLPIRRADSVPPKAFGTKTALTATWTVAALKVMAALSEDSRSRADSTCLVEVTARITMAAAAPRTGSLAADTRPGDSGVADLVVEGRRRCPGCPNSTALAEATLAEATLAAGILGIQAEVIRAVTGARITTTERVRTRIVLTRSGILGLKD